MNIKCLGLCVLLAACGVPEGAGEPSAATPTTVDLVEYISTDAIFLLRIDLGRGSDLWGTVFPGKVVDGQVSERELGDIRGSGPVYRCDVNGIPCLSLGHGIEFTVPPADALEWQVSTMHDWSYRILFLDRERCILVVEASNASFPEWRHRYGLEQGVGVTWIDLKGPGLGLSSADEFAHLVLRTPRGLLWDQDIEACSPSPRLR